VSLKSYFNFCGSGRSASNLCALISAFVSFLTRFGAVGLAVGGLFPPGGKSWRLDGAFVSLFKVGVLIF